VVISLAGATLKDKTGRHVTPETHGEDIASRIAMACEGVAEAAFGHLHLKISKSWP